jgi:hypothetical protein
MLQLSRDEHIYQDMFLRHHASDTNAHVLEVLVHPRYCSSKAQVNVGLCCLLLTLAEPKSHYCHFQTEILVLVCSFGYFSVGCSRFKSQQGLSDLPCSG